MTAAAHPSDTPAASGAAPSVRDGPATAANVLLLAIWVGIVAGLVEGAVVKIGALILHLPTGALAPAELFWIAPLAATLCLVVVALLLILLDRPLRPLVRVHVSTLALPIFAGLAVFSLIKALRQGVASIAAVVLAVGIGVVLARLLARRPNVTRRRLPRMVPWMVGALACYAVAIPSVRRVRESRALAALPAAPSGAPNVLVVVLDAVRHFDMSLYGYERPTTPELDRFAARGLVFDRAFTTTPWSLPSHASILTGRYPHEMTAGHRQPLDASLPLLSEVLAKHGYATGGFMGNLFWLQPDFGMDRGFISYSARPALSMRAVLSTWWLGLWAQETMAAWRGDHHEPVRRRASDVNDALMSWVSRRGGRPFFAFVNYFDAHEPYLPPAPFDTFFVSRTTRYWTEEKPRPYTPKELSDLRASYDAGIRYMDAQLKDLLDRLKARGELDRTIVVVTADHGEEFGEWDPSLIEHSMTLNTTSTLIPLVVVYPPRLPGGVRVAAPVSLRDIPATIVDLTGVRAEPPFAGVPLGHYAGDSASRAAPTPRVMVVEKRRKGDLPPWTANNGDLYSVVDGDFHYIRDALKRDHLYDLSADLWEKNDLAGQADMAPRLERMRFLLDSLVAGPNGTLRPRAPSSGRKLTSAIRRR